MTIFERLAEVASQIATNSLPRAKSSWGGARVIISSERSHPGEAGFYPQARWVVTEHALELSWLFERLRDAFFEAELIDGITKIEFFGRLGNSANRHLARQKNQSGRDLLYAVLHEAYAIAEEIQDGEFSTLSLAIGNEIADDYVDDALRTGFIGIEETLSFFANRGLDLRHD